VPLLIISMDHTGVVGCMAHPHTAPGETEYKMVASVKTASASGPLKRARFAICVSPVVTPVPAVVADVPVVPIVPVEPIVPQLGWPWQLGKGLGLTVVVGLAVVVRVVRVVVVGASAASNMTV